MNNTLFLCKVRYRKRLETGIVKKIIEQYLIKADSQKKAKKLIGGYLSSHTYDHDIDYCLTEANYKHVFYYKNDSGYKRYWYKSKVSMGITDEKTGKRKKNVLNILIHSENIHDAIRMLLLRWALENQFRIISIQETLIVGVLADGEMIS